MIIISRPWMMIERVHGFHVHAHGKSSLSASAGPFEQRLQDFADVTSMSMGYHHHDGWQLADAATIEDLASKSRLFLAVSTCWWWPMPPSLPPNSKSMTPTMSMHLVVPIKSRNAISESIPVECKWHTLDEVVDWKLFKRWEWARDSESSEFEFQGWLHIMCSL